MTDDAKYNDDVDSQLIGNYTYDPNGNLITDASENILGIKWNPYGKIEKIVKHDTVTEILFEYDGAGNRISKTYINGYGDYFITYYIRDAQGNILVTYDERTGHPVKIKEQMLYGSSRLGLWDRYIEAISEQDPKDMPIDHILGLKRYELTNHLGNVLTTVSDRKNVVTEGSYTADIQSAQDYYPGGSLMPGRKYSANAYRFGYQGSEKDDEITGVTGSHITTQFRQGDTRLVKWWSIDPKANATWSPYSMMNGNPIWLNDAEGDTIKIAGDLRFIMNTNMYIAMIRATDEGQIMLDVLENAETVYTIREASFYSNSAYNGNSSWIFNRKGGLYRSNTMYYDDNPWKSNLGGADIDGFLIFGHEFFHMYSDEMSLRVNGSYSGFYLGEQIITPAGEQIAEGGAMRFGNYLRTVYGYKNWKRSNQGKANTDFTKEWKYLGKRYFNSNNERITEFGLKKDPIRLRGSGLNYQKLNPTYKKTKTERGVTRTVDQDGNEVKKD